MIIPNPNHFLFADYPPTGLIVATDVMESEVQRLIQCNDESARKPVVRDGCRYTIPIAEPSAGRFLPHGAPESNWHR